MCEAILEAENSGYSHSKHINHLRSVLVRAEIVLPKEMPADVITMNSTALLTDLENGEQLRLTLCYPQDTRSEDQVSVLAPIGSAMLGYSVGDCFEWETPAGKVNLRVDKVIFQPKAAGLYD